MSVQNTGTIDSTPFVLRGLPEALVKNNATILTDGARTTPLAPYTIMAKVAATGKYVPLTSVTATNGSSIPAGIYIGDSIAAADIAAADVTDVKILTGMALVDESKLVLENSLTLATVFTANAAGTGAATPYLLETIRDLLQRIAIIPTLTQSVTL